MFLDVGYGGSVFLTDLLPSITALPEHFSRRSLNFGMTLLELPYRATAAFSSSPHVLYLSGARARIPMSDRISAGRPPT